jgi:DNA-binding transcriptional MerR regulator
VLRIGEMSRRVGVSGHVLRAWESRCGLLRPARSPGGYRLYAEADASRVRQMQAQLARGLSAAEAARAVLMSGLSLTAVLRDVVLPYLAELGDRWERGTASIAQEHFASNVIRGRLARGWATGTARGPSWRALRGNGMT